MVYLELELRSEEVQGAHEIGGRVPLSRGQAVGPLALILSPKNLLIPKSASVDFQDIPRTFLFYT